MNPIFNKNLECLSKKHTESVSAIKTDSESSEDLPLLDPEDYKIVAFTAPSGEGKLNTYCMGCWIRTNFSFKYQNGHPKNKICFYCQDAWAIRSSPQK